MLFAFGFSLNNQKKKSKNYSFRHLIIVILLVLLYFFDTNIVSIRMYHLLLSYTVADGIIIKLLYVSWVWRADQPTLLALDILIYLYNKSYLVKGSELSETF